MNAHDPTENLSREDCFPRNQQTTPARSVGSPKGPNPTQPVKRENQPLDEQVLDRLVDGELSESEQQEVLRQLEAHPENWRRLALAFLEALMWKRELPSCVEFQRSPPTEMSKPTPASLFPFSHRLGSRKWAVLTIAGGILIAFLGGYFFRDLGVLGGFREREIPVVQGPTPNQREIQDAPLPGEVQSKSPNIPKSPQDQNLPKGPILAGKGEEVWRKGQEQPGREVASPAWEYVTLASGTGRDGIPEVVRVPVVPLPPGIRAWGQQSVSSIPEDIVQMLRRSGMEVSHSRRLVPLRMEDGRRVVIPVEQVELHHGPTLERYQ